MGRETGVDKHVRATLSERCHQRYERGVAEIGARHVAEQHDAIESELTVTALKLGERVVEVWERQHAESGESAGGRSYDLGDAVVGEAGDGRRVCGRGAGRARRSDGQDRRID